uniref:Olfactory receptor n=1 Tax=Denticeps clupeoides TaxID=299321 RepID=A0AAY4DG02_9TELE
MYFELYGIDGTLMYFFSFFRKTSTMNMNISFTLDGYRGMYQQRFIYAAVLALFYPVTIIANSIIIYVICADKSLHKPMYIFICNLSCINLYGSSSFVPFLLHNIFTKSYDMPWFACLVQIFYVNTYCGCEITNLVVMAYDRYISVCFPLYYEKFMSTSKVIVLIALTWLIPFCRCSITISITAKLPICGRIIEKVYCDNYSVLKLSCSNMYAISSFNLTLVFLFLVLPFFFILYSYIKIISICLTLPRTKQSKVLNTCLPHMVVIFNFFTGSSFEIYQSRFDMSYVPYPVRVMLSLYFLILPPFLNPIIYGARTQNIKNAINRKYDKLFKCK